MRAFLCALLIDDENYVMIIIRFDRVFFVFLIYIIITNTSLFLINYVDEERSNFRVRNL